MNESEKKTTKSPIPIIFAIPFGPFLISPKAPPKENKLEIKILKIEKARFARLLIRKSRSFIRQRRVILLRSYIRLKAECYSLCEFRNE